jgi:anti-anti-sigma regulatory factor
VDVRPDSDGLEVVSIEGEIDLYVAPTLNERFLDASRRESVPVDLSSLRQVRSVGGGFCLKDRVEDLVAGYSD